MKDLKLKCEYVDANGLGTGAIIYIEGTQPRGGEFTEIRRKTFSYHALPPEIQTACTAYGLRALLADRTSDAAKLGVNKLDWMADVYKMLETGELKKKAAGKQKGIDRALVMLLMDLKGIPYPTAEAALATKDKEWLDALAAKYADQLATIRAELAAAEAIDLDDLF